MANQRILRATAAPLSWQPLDYNGEPTDPDVVTVGVVSSDGATVKAAGTATAGSGSDPRTVTLTAAQTAEVDILTATWKVGATTVAITYHDVVGGFLFSLADLRGTETSVGDPSAYEAARLRTVRDEVEALFESVCGPFHPRLSVVRVNGCTTRFRPTGGLLRSVRWVRQYSDYTVPTYTDYTDAEVAQVVVGDDGYATLPYSLSGWLSVEIGYEHGRLTAPADVRRAAMLYARSLSNRQKSGVPDRATTMQLPDGGSVTLATPGVGRWHTGIPEVDEVLRRYPSLDPLVA